MEMPEKPFHHGDLRRVLIKAGLALLDEEGPEGMTLRRAAQRARVSHAAPAHHFGNKQGLVIAIAAEGFRIFTRLMQEERFRQGPDPQEQLRGICRGYLRFASEHDALFRMIFTIEIKSDPDPALQEAAIAAFQVLVDVCALFEPSPAGASVNEIAIWSLVHGYAGLNRFSHLQDPTTGAVIEFDKLLPPMVPRPPH